MKASDAKYVAELIDNLQGIIDARKGLQAEKPDDRRPYKRFLNISVDDEVEGDFFSDYCHGGSKINMDAAPQVLEAIEKFFRAELERLKVEI